MDSVLQRPPFVPFDRKQAVRIYLRNLPHWRQDGATYFLTFRLHDSLPAKALEVIKFEEEKWLAARGIESNPDRRKNLEKLSRREGYLYRKHLNRLREQVHDKGYGACWLNQLPIIDVLREQILQDDGGVLHIGDFIIMPNHVHMLAVPTGRKLELCMKRIKGSSAVYCNRILGRSGTFWQADTFDHIVRNVEQLEKYRQYIRNNPANAGIKVADNAYYQAEWMSEWLSEWL